MRDQWLVWAVLSAVFAAATALLSKVALRGVDADAAQLVRTAVVLAAMAALAAMSGAWRGVREFNGRTWVCLVLAGGATAASWICYFRALAAGEASRVAAIDKLSVVIVAVVAALALGERLGSWGWFGVVLAIAGVMLISLARSGS